VPRRQPSLIVAQASAVAKHACSGCQSTTGLAGRWYDATRMHELTLCCYGCKGGSGCLPCFTDPRRWPQRRGGRPGRGHVTSVSGTRNPQYRHNARRFATTLTLSKQVCCGGVSARYAENAHASLPLGSCGVCSRDRDPLQTGYVVHGRRRIGRRHTVSGVQQGQSRTRWEVLRNGSNGCWKRWYVVALRKPRWGVCSVLL
jgi:hypothetical protein